MSMVLFIEDVESLEISESFLLTSLLNEIEYLENCVSNSEDQDKARKITSVLEDLAELFQIVMDPDTQLSKSKCKVYFKQLQGSIAAISSLLD